MTSLKQIQEVHDKFGKPDMLVEYLTAQRRIGVMSYDSFIADGHSEYYLLGDESIVSEPLYDSLMVAHLVDKERFLAIMDKLSQENMDYFPMMKELSKCGVIKWTFDTVKLTHSYIGYDGSVLLVESLSK